MLLRVCLCHISPVLCLTCFTLDISFFYLLITYLSYIGTDLCIIAFIVDVLVLTYCSHIYLYFHVLFVLPFLFVCYYFYLFCFYFYYLFFTLPFYLLTFVKYLFLLYMDLVQVLNAKHHSLWEKI